MLELLDLTQMVYRVKTMLRGFPESRSKLNRYTSSHVSRRAAHSSNLQPSTAIILSFRTVYNVLQALLKLLVLTRTSS